MAVSATTIAKLVGSTALIVWNGGVLFRETKQLEMLRSLQQRNTRVASCSSKSDIREDRHVTVPLNDTKAVVRALANISAATYMNETAEEVSIMNGIGFGGVLEMEDPFGGRNHRCFEKYFKKWVESLPESSRLQLLERMNPTFGSFFDWLDYGAGRAIEVPKCEKSSFDMKRYKKLTPTERKKYEIELGINQTLDALDGTFQFVYGTDRHLYIVDEKRRVDKAHIGHASVFNGRPVLMAGEVEFASGQIRWISDSSGHYRPTKRHVHNFYLDLRDLHSVDVASIRWIVRGECMNTSLPTGT